MFWAVIATWYFSFDICLYLPLMGLLNLANLHKFKFSNFYLIAMLNAIFVDAIMAAGFRVDFGT